MHHRLQCVAAAIILLGTTVPSAAQVAPSPQSPCGDGQRSQTEGTAQRPSNPGDQKNPGDQNLSDKLSQSDGVLCPPNVDPEIKAPTPQGGAMPVIPPPGSPGGDPAVRPK